MNAFSLGELATAVTIMCAALGGLLAVCMKSRCDRVTCCCGLVKLHRTLPADATVVDVAPPAPPAVVESKQTQPAPK